jgi:hypothetical protein
MRRAAAAAGHASKTAAAAAAAKQPPRAPPRVTLKYEDSEADVQAAAEGKVTPAAAPPPHWREWHALIEKMREGRDAPVDMMGAGEAVSPKTEPPFQTLSFEPCV